MQTTLGRTRAQDEMEERWRGCQRRKDRSFWRRNFEDEGCKKGRCRNLRVCGLQFGRIQRQPPCQTICQRLVATFARICFPKRAENCLKNFVVTNSIDIKIPNSFHGLLFREQNVSKASFYVWNHPRLQILKHAHSLFSKNQFLCFSALIHLRMIWKGSCKSVSHGVLIVLTISYQCRQTHLSFNTIPMTLYWSILLRGRHLETYLSSIGLFMRDALD